MTPIEDTPIETLVRQALAQTPSPTPATDPLATIDRRVRRARRWVAAGAGAAAAVVAAAIVVPLTVLSGNQASKVGVITPPPSATPSPSDSQLHLVTPEWTDGARSFSASPQGERWLLFQRSADSSPSVVNLAEAADPANEVAVQAPADDVFAGDRVVWVVGDGTDTNTARVSAIDPVGDTVATLTFPDVHLGSAAVIGDSLYVAATDASGSGIDRIDLTNGAVSVTASKPLPQAAEMQAAAPEQVWVHAGKKLVKIDPIPNGLTLGPAFDWGSGPVVGGQVVGPGGPEAAVWAFDGRLIGLTPGYLQSGVSIAEGMRIDLKGQPQFAVSSHDGGLFVAVTQVGGPGGSTAVDYYSPRALARGSSAVTDELPVHVTSLAADPNGGVDYVDDAGRLMHWEPAGAGSR